MNDKPLGGSLRGSSRAQKQKQIPGSDLDL